MGSARPIWMKKDVTKISQKKSPQRASVTTTNRPSRAGRRVTISSVRTRRRISTRNWADFTGRRTSIFSSDEIPEPARQGRRCRVQHGHYKGADQRHRHEGKLKTGVEQLFGVHEHENQGDGRQNIEQPSLAEEQPPEAEEGHSRSGTQYGLLPAGDCRIEPDSPTISSIAISRGTAQIRRNKRNTAAITQT